MSPNQPMSANPRSVSSQQPATPNVDVKPQLPILMSAITSSNDNQNKNSVSSPRPSTSNADPLQSTSNSEGTRKSPEEKSNKSTDESNSTTSFSLKRPVLNTRDYEVVNAEDYASYQMLYDYATWDAW